MIQAIEMRDGDLWVCIDGVFIAASGMVNVPLALTEAAQNETAIPDDVRLTWRKAERAAAVAAIVVTTASGKTFDGDEDSQARMSRALQVALITGQTETTWVLANNVPTLINLDELREALALSMQAQSAVWSAPYEN